MFASLENNRSSKGFSFTFILAANRETSCSEYLESLIINVGLVRGPTSGFSLNFFRLLLFLVLPVSMMFDSFWRYFLFFSKLVKEHSMYALLVSDKWCTVVSTLFDCPVDRPKTRRQAARNYGFKIFQQIVFAKMPWPANLWIHSDINQWIVDNAWLR